MPEVQKHGFSWEKELLLNVYKADAEKLKKIGYTAAADCPAECNGLDGVSLSIKTTGSKNAVYMGDVLRFYDETHSEKPLHLTVIYYEQKTPTTKAVLSVVEVDLTGAGALLFGTLTREQIAELDALVKKVPQKRKPTTEEHAEMYALRDRLSAAAGPVALCLDIKCNSQQSRVQSHFNAFQAFLAAHPERVVARSEGAAFRGGAITPEITSGRRVLKKKASAAAAAAQPAAESPGTA